MRTAQTTWRWLSVGMLAAVTTGAPACSRSSEGPVRVVPIGRVGRALMGITGVSATAFVVPRGGVPETPGTALTAGDDGVSFSGFIEVEPGDYSLEIVFRGQPDGAPGPLFLGRWASDAFTVVEGANATPVFSTPIDTIGRPEDEGDRDGDGLGLLDEYLWDADPNAFDADSDGTPDGIDCSPGVVTDTFPIAAGGTIEDCDGDGVLRPDIPYAPGGRDCNDRDAAINPGATDDCADDIDQDCNPSTCPTDDVTPPTVLGVIPAAGTTLGCHAALEVDLDDDRGVTNAFLEAPDLVSGGLTMLVGEPVDGMPGRWRFPPFNTLALGTLDGLRAGSRTVTISAIDGAGNTGRREVSFEFSFARPSVTSMTPLMVGQQNTPFQVTVTATDAVYIALRAAARGNNGIFLSDERAQVLGEISGTSATFTVDPAMLGDGTWLLFPVAEDAIGNRLQPVAFAVPSPTPGVGTLQIDADYRCVTAPAAVKMPARVLTVDPNGPPSSTGWKPLLARALSEAEAANPELELVSVIGFGVDAQGRIDLADATSFIKRWTFGFRVPQTENTFSVTWLTPLANPGDNPLVDPAGSGVVPEAPIAEPNVMPDSTDVLTQFQTASMCRPLAGRDDDLVIYSVVDDVLQVLLSNEEGDTWRASINADGELTENIDCP